MTEHGVLKRILLAYRAASTRISTGRPVPHGAVLDAAQIISDYVEGFHEGLEEAYIFPRVARHGHGALVDTLLTQHDRGRHLTATTLQLASQPRLTPDHTDLLRQCLDRFVTMYEPHEAWEDTVIYPALRAHTPQRTLDELADRFHTYESVRYSDDALDDILQRVVRVEEQLDIADLSTFTPPA